MRKVLLFFIFLTIHLAAGAQSDTIRYVKPRDKGGAYTNDGLSWAKAKDNIQDAINDMRTYMQQHGLHSGNVYVASGSYEPTDGVEGGTNGQLSTSFIIYQGIHVYGGFNVDSPEAKPDDRELYYTVDGQRATKKMSEVEAGDTTIIGFRMAHTTYLDGNHNHNAQTTVRWNRNRKRYDTSFPGNSYHVVFFASRGFINDSSHPGYADSLQYQASVDGFTIRYGNAAGATDVRQGGRDHTAMGGGVYMVKNSVVRNCIIQMCSAALRGGGVYMDGGGELISSNVSRCQTLGAGVSGGLGGGVCIDNGGSVRGSWITGNVARLGGGIALMSYPENHPRGSQSAYNRGDFDPFVSATIVSNNTATTEGGGIYLDRGGIVNHATIVRNDNTGRDISYGRTRYGRTGGLFIYGAGQVYNSVIWGNTCQANNDIQYAATTADVSIPSYISLRQPLLSYTAISNLDITNFTGTVRSSVYSFESVNNDPKRSGNFPLFLSPTNGSGCGQGPVSITSWFPYSKTSLQNKAVRLDAAYMPASNFSVTSMASADFFNRQFPPVSTLGAVETGMEEIETAMVSPVDTADCGGSTAAIPTLFVDPNRIIEDPTAKAGASWEEPLDNIAEAIEYFRENHQDGNYQILVKQGTTTCSGIGAYYEVNSNRPSVSLASIRLLPNLKMYGGFPSSNTGTDTKNRNPKDYATRISGNIISGSYQNNALHVVSFARAHDAVLDGFQIYYGNARHATEVTSAEGGGAVIADNFFFTPDSRISMTGNVVRNCVLANSSGPVGGAVYVNSGYTNAAGETIKASLTLENCIINNCGGPVNIIQASGPSTIKMDHCTVVGNIVNRGGSLMSTTVGYGVGGTIEVTNSAFHGNITGSSQDKPATVNAVTPSILLPLTSGNNITASNNITDKDYSTETPGFSRLFGFDSNDTLSYPGFANPVRDLGVAENVADNTVYGGPADYTPLDMNPMVNRATASGDHTTWGTDLTATVTRDYGGAPDVGALECHQGTENANGGQATYGSVIYVRDYNTYNSDGSIAKADNSTDGRDGTSWTKAINGNAIYNATDTTLIGLQYAVNQASADNGTAKPQVWVAEGIYTNKSANTINDQNYAFSMKECVNVFGGFPGNGNPSMNERDPKSFVTILQPQNEDPTDTTSALIRTSAASVARVLVQPNDFTTETSWNGFTIRYGYLQSVYQRDIKGNISDIRTENIGTSGGAGAYLMENGVLENCELIHNTILVDPEQRATGKLRVINGNTDQSNHGGGYHQAGAGVYITTTNRSTGVGGTLKNCVVAYNDLLHKLTLIDNDGSTHSWAESVWMYGAGVYQDRGIIYNTIIHDNSMLVFQGNTSTSGTQVNEVLVGAGAFLVRGQFYNNTIVNNTARTYGSGGNNIHIRIPGVYVYTDITMYNSIVSDNTSDGTANTGINAAVFDVPVCAFALTGGNAKARYALDASKVKVHYSFINITKEHNDNLCDTEDGNNTNIYLNYNRRTRLDQQYTTDKIFDKGSYRLVSGSPCINAGTDDIANVTIPSYDASYADRIQDCTIDIGAYEYNGAQDITPRVTTETVYPFNNNGTRVEKVTQLAEYFVNQNGSGNSSADSPTNAACQNKLQRVLDAAGRYKYDHPKTHVVIRLEALPDSAGYTPTRSTVTIPGEANPRSYSFIVPMGVEIDGGWPTNGNFGIDSEGKLHRKDPINNITRLSGEYVSGTQTVNVYHVVTFTDQVYDENGQPTDKRISDVVKLYMPGTAAQAAGYNVTDHIYDRAKLRGLYIEGGRAEGINEADQNGAAAVMTSYSMVSNCIVRDNHANGSGGAFYMLPGSVLEGSIIENNTAANGGAVAVAEEDSSEEELPWAFLLSNTVTRNTATGRGGGLYFTDNARTWNSVYWNNTGAEQNDISGITDTDNEQNIQNSPVNFCAITNQNIAGNNNINLSPQDENGTRWGTDTNLKQKHDFDYYLPSRASVLTRAGMPYDVLHAMLGMMPGIDSLDIAGVSRMQYTRADSLVCDTAYDGEKLVLKNNYAIEIGARALNDNFSITIDPAHPLYRLFVAHPENMNANTAQDLMDSNDAYYKQQGSSFANPFLRLTDALNYVVDARKTHPEISRNKRFEIFLAEGTYAPFADMYGRQENVRSHTFVVPEEVSIYGGIDARNPNNQYCQSTNDGQTITVDTVKLIGASTDSIRLRRERFDLNQNSIVEPWEMSHATVLTGLTEGSDFMVHNVYHVITSIADPGVVGSQPDMRDDDNNIITDRDKESLSSRGTRAIILDGLTVSDGAAMNYESSVYNPSLYFRGGGVCVSGDSMSTRTNVSDMKIGDRNVLLVISNSLFQNNTARLGGAIFSDGPVHIVGSSFVQNLTESPTAADTADIKYVTFSGGGAIATNSNVFATNTIFANNESRDGGADIVIDRTGATKRINVSNTTEVDSNGNQIPVINDANKIRGYGGMIWAGDHSGVRLVNCNSVRNKAHAYASIYNCTPNTTNSGMGHPHFGINCIFWGNQVDAGQDSLLMNYNHASKIGGLYFSAYQEGKGLPVTVTPDIPDSVFQKSIIEGGYADIFNLDSIMGNANHNIILSDDNNAIDGPNFTLPSNEPGVDGYMPSADWVPSRINRLCDAGWGSIRQTPDGQFVKEPNIDLDNRETWFINGMYGLLADFYMREFHITLLPQGDEKYMMYANDDGTEGDRNMNRISADPLGTITRDYIDIGVYEYQHTLLHIADGDEVDELWVSDDETTGNNDGRDIDHPTSDLQRAIQTLLQSRNDHPKVIHIMEGTYSPIYELDGTNYGFQIHNTPSPSNIALPKTITSGHGYQATSITFLGGYSKTIKGQRDPDRYPTVLRMVKRTNSTDANIAHLFYIGDAEQWKTSGALSGSGGSSTGSETIDLSRNAIDKTSFTTGAAMPVVFDGMTFINPYASDDHKDIDGNGSAVSSPYTSGTASGGAAIYYREQFKSAQETVTQADKGTPDKSANHLEPLSDAPKLTIRNCKFEDNADSTSHNVPAVFVGKGGGRTVVYNSLFDDNHGSPIISFDPIAIVNCTFARNGGHVTVKTDEAQAKSSLSNSILWETLDETTANTQYEGFAADSVRHNAIYGISGDADANGNVGLSATNSDPMNGPNFLNVTNALGQPRDYSLNPGMKTMDHADAGLYDLYTAVFKNGVTIPDADSSIVILRPDTTMEYDLSWGARYFGNGLDVGAYECRVKQQRVLYVRPSQPTNTTGTEIGSSWENYYGNKQLQTAIDAAAIYASTNRKRAYVLVKGEANNTAVQDAVSLRNNVSIYGSIPENFLQSISEDDENSDDAVSSYISSMIASRPGIAARSARRSRIAGIRTDDSDYSDGALIDGFEVRSTADPQVPTVYITKPVVLSKVIVDGNRTTNGRPVVEMQEGLMYNSLVFGNVPRQNATGSVPMMYIGANAAVLNSTIVSDSVGIEALGGEGYLANSITYGFTDRTLTAMKGDISRAGTIVCDSVNTLSGIPFAPYLMEDVNPIKLSSYITDFQPYNYQLHESSSDITGGNDNLDDIIANAPGSDNAGAKYILTMAKDQGWVDFKKNHDILGNLRFFGSHIDRGCYETWYVKAGTTETATADNYPHEGSVVYIMRGASLNLGQAGGDPIYTSVNPFKPAFLLMGEDASLYGNGNTILVPYIAVEKTLPKGRNYALVSLPFRYKIGDAVQTFYDTKTGQINAQAYTDFEASLYDGGKRSAWDYHFQDDNSDCWTPIDRNEILAPNTGWLATLPDHDDETVRLVAAAETDGDYVYTEYGTPKTVSLIQHDATTSTNGAHFTKAENMGWNIIGLPYLVSNYKTGAADDDGSTYPMNVPHVIYTMDADGKFSTMQSWDDAAVISFGAGIMTQTAIISNDINKGVETVTFALPHQDDGGSAPAEARQMITVSSGNGMAGDELQINASENAKSLQYTLGSDGVKWLPMNRSLTSIYALTDGGTPLSLSAATPVETNIPVVVSGEITNGTTVGISDAAAFDSVSHVWLIDNETGYTVDLKDGPMQLTPDTESADGTTTGVKSLTLRLGDTRPDGSRDAGSGSVHIYLTGRMLHIDGLHTGDEIGVYTISGQLYLRTIAEGNSYTCELRPGVYVVRAAGRGQAVGVK